MIVFSVLLIFLSFATLQKNVGLGQTMAHETKYVVFPTWVSKLWPMKLEETMCEVNFVVSSITMLK
jgi:hypothetical protein